MSDKFLEAFGDATNVSYTENGAKAYTTTKNALLDAFGSLGSAVHLDNDYILKLFVNAYSEDRELALRYLFYLRDVRGGQGMRKAFRICALWLADNRSEDLINNIENIPYYGRWDDMFYIYNSCLSDKVKNRIIDCIKHQLSSDLDNYANGNYKDISLLAKWMPSINTSSADTRNLAHKLRCALEMRPAVYRKVLSKLRKALNVVEVNLSGKTYENIDYPSVPSKAAQKYADAFYTHDESRYLKYIEDIMKGDAKINADALFPVDIVKKAWGECVSTASPNAKSIVIGKILNAQWNALPDYFKDRNETGICVVDTSGSMYGTPILVALSLGLYCADRCKGPYKNHFITFSRNPFLQKIKGETLSEKLMSMSDAGWGMDTDLEKVFKLILDTANRNHLRQDEIPNKLYIISDMQFNQATTDSTSHYMQAIKQLYEESGYIMPSVVYWNVGAYETGIYHQTIDDVDFCMVSGYSSSLFKSVIDGTEYVETTDEEGNVTVKQSLDPMRIMLTAIMNERYDRVWVK